MFGERWVYVYVMRMIIFQLPDSSAKPSKLNHEPRSLINYFRLSALACHCVRFRL